MKSSKAPNQLNDVQVRRLSDGRPYALIEEGLPLLRDDHGRVSGPPLIVLVPGVPSSERDFRTLAPLLGRWASVISVIFQGFGVLSECVDAPSSTRDRAQYLSQIADQEGWHKILTVGHSMGGVASLGWAVEDSRIVGLCFLSSVGVVRHRGMAIDAKTAKLCLKLMYIPLIGQLIEKRFRTTLLAMGFKGHPLHRRQLQLILEHVRDLSFEENMKLIQELRARKDLSLSLIWTEDDRVVDAYASQRLIKALSEALPLEILKLSTGGHNPQRSRTIEIEPWLRSRYSELVSS